MKKRILSLLLALVMVLSFIPMPVSAADTEGATLTLSGNNTYAYRNKYVVITDGSKDALYYINNSGTVQNTDGTAATFAPGTYTVYYGIFSGWSSSFAQASVTVRENDTQVGFSLRGANVNSNTSYAIRELYATSLYYNTSAFNHVDLRVAASYEIHVGNQVYTATVYNPSVVVKVGGQQVASKSWDGSTDYEWRQDGLTLTRSSLISVELTLDLHYTDSSGKTHILEDVLITYDNANNLDKFIEAIAICDMVWGLDFRVSVQEIEKEIRYHAVSYEWKVYNTDGTYTSLPAGAPSAPAATSGHEAGSQYAYDTEYVTGTSFYDYDNGLLYTFHGWDTYSHSGTFNTDPTAAGYAALDDGDTNASNNQAIEITDDTYIYGYWTVTELTPSSAHIAIEKVFIVDGEEVPIAEAEDLWFRIDTGIDRDGDGDTEIDVDYPMIAASAGGEYKIPVYQYDTPFVFTEYNADVPGYTRTTTVTVSGDYITGRTVSGDSVTVTMEPVYQGENVHLGTVTYTNTYTRNTGDPVQVYPTLTVLKSTSDTHAAQDGVTFTLYADEACETAVATVTTADGGLAFLHFGSVANVAPGTYYLKETAPLTGYKADPYVYAITLTASAPVEELRDGQFVQVTYHTLSVAVPEGSTASHQDGSNRIHIYNEPVLGSLNVAKAISGLSDSDKSKLRAAVIVHGPISRDDAGAITDIGDTWQLELTQSNSWSASIGQLPLGEYLIHESFASVHGYTWTGVTYGNLPTTVYNNITSGIIKVESDTPITLTLTNTYKEWESADFFIKKIDEDGNALAGAVFTLSTDEAGNNVIATQTTGADGYAHFEGFQAEATYYLRETKAPNGYYLSDQLYKVTISAVSVNGNTTYEPEIVLVAGRSTGFDINTDLLTVTNFPVLGQLTITKTFANGLIPQGLTGVSIQVGGPNGFSQTVELNASNSWSATLENLRLGEYTVYELDANVPGYTWNVTYSGETVALIEENPGMSVPGTTPSGSATVTNAYTRNEEVYEIPTVLTVKKVGENGEALAGAVFQLDRMDASGRNVISSVSFTTGAEGTVVFDLLSGFIQEDQAIDGTYILSEVKAPAGYELTGATWTVTVKEDDGEVRWELNENKNIFEGFWDWVTGNVSAGTFENGILTVRNIRSKGSLTVRKVVTDPQEIYSDALYTFTLDASDDSFDKAFTLKAGESITVENIPWGTTYTLTENTTGAAFTCTITDEGNGKIWAESTLVTVTNTYAYTTYKAPLSLIKVDADDNTKVISGAGFTLYEDEALQNKLGSEVFSDENGRVTLAIEAAGTYYLAETTAPAGYYPNAKVYVITAEEVPVVKNAGTTDAVTEQQLHIRIAGLTGTTENQIDYTYLIENTAIKTVPVTVTKVWNDGGYHARPASVNVTLYKDGEAYETVALNEENDWSYTWAELANEFTWTVDEAEVPAEYTKAVTNDGNDWTVTNTRQLKEIDVSVKKKWEGDNVTHPTSIKVTLYRNGIAYDTVTLSEGNGWQHTWKNLTDNYSWSVDESSVPGGYEKSVRRNGTSFTITNTYNSNPKTGDLTDLAGLITMMGFSGSGLGLTLFLRRKKEEEET